MVTETFGYVVRVALLGLGVVFLSLWALSLLMSLIKRLFDRQERRRTPPRPSETHPHAAERRLGGPTGARSPGAAGRAPGAAGGEGSAVSAQGVPDWVVPAVVAFLFEEERKGSAEPWKPVHADRYDPWVLQVRGGGG